MRNVVLIIFYASPIIDSITGYFMGISGTDNAISKVYRSVAFVVLYMVYLKNAGIKKVMYQILLTAYSVLLLLYYMLYGGRFIVDSSYIMKLFYPIVLVSVSKLLYKKKQLSIADINKVIQYYSLSYPFIIMVSTLLGIGHSAYRGSDNNGYMGLFSGGNEISIVLSILFMINIQQLYSKTNTYDIIAAVLLGFSLLMTQTKTSYIIATITVLLFIVKKIIKYPAKLHKNIILILIVVVCIVVFISTQEKQIVIMIDRLVFKYHQLGNNFFNMLFSNRQNKILPIAKANYMSGMNGILNLLFGRGFYTQVLKDNNDTFGLIEMDLFDILFQNGIIMLCIVIRFYWCIAKQSSKSKNIFMVFAYTMTLLFSIFAGHVLYNPLSSTVLALLCIYVYVNKDPFGNRMRKYLDQGYTGP